MSPEFLLFFLLACAGLLGGFLAGLLGIGGGLIYIALLPEVCTALGSSPEEITQFTIANSLFATLIGSFTASLSHIKAKGIQLRSSAIIGVSAIITSSLVLLFFVNTPYYQQKHFQVFVMVLLAYMIIRTLRTQEVNFNEGQVQAKIEPYKLVLVGMVGGFVSPLSGLGGSIVMIPLLRNWLKIEIKKAGIISIGVVFFQSLTSTFINAFFAQPESTLNTAHLGYVILPISLILGGTVAVSSPLGAMTSRKLSSQVITVIFLLTLAGILLKQLIGFL